jgi:hypothetical protein
MKISKFTYVLIVIVFGTLGLTVVRHAQTQAANKYKDDEVARQQQQKKERFPTADYDEPELTDAKKNLLRKEKQLRKNDFKIVASNPPDWQFERVFIGEGALDFPGLPVAESTYIILGEVTAAEAHLSENKKNVYSEFTVAVNRAFKTARSSITEGSEVTVDRIGGFVKYPNGRTLLYRISGTNMPLVGLRYVFFLTSKNNQDLSILTAYELGTIRVVPLDESPQFEKFRGLTEDVFLQNLRDSLAKSSPY